MSFPVSPVGSATANALGVADVQLGPVPVGDVWQIASVTVACDVDNPMPEARVYRNSVAPTNLLAGTYTGALDTGPASIPVELAAGESLIVHWTGAAVGAGCVATAVGRSGGRGG